MIKESLINILVWGLLFLCAGSVFGTLGVLVLSLIDWLVGLLWKSLKLLKNKIDASLSEKQDKEDK